MMLLILSHLMLALVVAFITWLYTTYVMCRLTYHHLERMLRACSTTEQATAIVTKAYEARAINAGEYEMLSDRYIIKPIRRKHDLGD